MLDKNMNNIDAEQDFKVNESHRGLLEDDSQRDSFVTPKRDSNISKLQL